MKGLPISIKQINKTICCHQAAVVVFLITSIIQKRKNCFHCFNVWDALNTLRICKNKKAHNILSSWYRTPQKLHQKLVSSRLPAESWTLPSLFLFQRASSRTYCSTRTILYTLWDFFIRRNVINYMPEVIYRPCGTKMGYDYVTIFQSALLLLRTTTDF